jgi:hypothetical protein
MATAELKVRIDADIKQYQDALNKSVKETDIASNQIEKSVGGVVKSFTILNSTKFTFGKNYVSASETLANQSKKTSETLGGATVKSSNQAAFALQNLGRVAQDAPFGFIGIQNNLNPLLESFQALKKESGSTGGALKTLVGSLTGAGGIGLALSVVTAAFTFAQVGLRAWGVTASDTKKEIDKTTKSLKDQKDEFLQSPYQNAAISLSDLTTKISLAKQGFLDKESVLKQYNESIGKTIGKVKDLDSAEQAIVDNGGKYLQLMLLKAKAEFAFKKAAEQSYEIVKKQNEIEVNKNPLNLDKKALADLEKLGKKPINALILQTQFDEQTELKKLNTFADRAVNIANTAQQEVLDFAKKSGFNLEGIFDIQVDKAIEGKKKELNEFEKLEVDFQKRIAEIRVQGGKFAADLIIGNIQRESEKAKINIDFIDPAALDLAVSQSEVAAKSIVDNFAAIKAPLLTPFQNLNLYIKDSVLPQLSTSFKTFFDDILMNGKFSFAALGKAILNTFASVIASQAANGVINLLSGAISSGGGGGGTTGSNTGGKIAAVGGLAGLVGKLFKGGSKVAEAGGEVAKKGLGKFLGTALPIAGVALAAAPILFSLFKKKQPQPQQSYTTSNAISTSSSSNVDFGNGRVVFEISGVNLVGVLNRAGAKLQRFGP